MTLQEMQGPFPLSEQTIRHHVTEDKPGLLVLGRWDGQGFDIRYVGHAERKLADRLAHWVSAFPHFLYRYTRDIEEARQMKRSMLAMLGSRRPIPNPAEAEAP
jgi:hypothetical protein